jgi:hypothetical protein
MSPASVSCKSYTYTFKLNTCSNTTKSSNATPLNKAVVALVGGSHGAYTDNLCFFRCLAVHRGVVGVQDLETPAKTYYRQCLQQQDMTLADFKGVTLMSVQHPNIFPQPVTFRTQVAVTL